MGLVSQLLLQYAKNTKHKKTVIFSKMKAANNARSHQIVNNPANSLPIKRKLKKNSTF